MKNTILSIAALTSASSVASAVLIVGTDFSSDSEFGTDPPGSVYDKTNIDNFQSGIGITVTTWQGGAGFPGSADANSLPGMTGADTGDNLFAGKIRGQNNVDGAEIIALGDDLAASIAKFPSSPNFFEITIPVGVTLNLTSLTFEHRNATGGPNGRTFSVGTTLTDTIIYHVDNAPGRNSSPNTIEATIPLSGAEYQNLTDTTFQIHFMTQTTGTGASDHDIDNIYLFGTIVPEPSTAALLGLASLALMGTRRRHEAL